MKVIHFIRGFQKQYGSEIFINLLIREQIAFGHYLKLVVLNSLPKSYLNNITSKGIEVEELRLQDDWFSAAKQLAFETTMYGADIIHSHLGICDVILSSIIDKINIPVVTTKYSNYLFPHKLLKRLMLQPNDPEGVSINICMDASITQRFHSVICVSKDIASYYMNLGVLECRVHVIHNASLSRFLPPISVKCLAKHKPPEFITALRFEAEKNLNLVIRTAEILVTQGVSFTWKVFGEGVNYPDIVNEVKKHRLEKHLMLPGYIPHGQLIEHLSTANVLVHTGVSEGLPMVVIEALSLNIPVITTPTEGINELLVSDSWGIKTNSHDPVELANAIQVVLNRNLDIKSSTYIRDNFTIESACKKTLAVYDDLLGRKET